MMGKFLTNLKGAFESEELFLLNYRKKTRILNDVTNGPKKEYAKTLLYIPRITRC